MLEADRKFSVVRLDAYRDAQLLWQATGFFLSNKNAEYLITNHHVVWDEDPDQRPTLLRMRVHSSRTNLSANTEVDLPLYDQGTRCWLEHPSGADVDIVAIPIEAKKRSASCPIPITAELPGGLIVPLAQDAYVMGFPLGFADEVHNLSVVRRATIASDFSTDFEGMPCFLVDANLHEGMSGSPVFARASDVFDLQSGALHISEKPVSYFLGVFSAEWTIESTNTLGQTVEDPLQLNTIWRTSALRQVLAHGGSK